MSKKYMQILCILISILLTLSVTVQDGWYTVYVKETDRYGNSVTESRSFEVDTGM